MPTNRFKLKRDGETIKGEASRKAGTNQPILIISAEMGHRMSKSVQFQHFFIKCGYATFMFDYCGGCRFGSSSGKSTDMTIHTEMDDLKAVVEYAKSLDYTDSESVTIFGLGHGGLIAALVAAELNDEIERLILFSPTFAIPDEVRVGRLMGGKFDPNNIVEPILGGGLKLGKKYVDFAKDLDVFDIIGKFEGPVTIAHGTMDEVSDISYTRRASRIYKNATLDDIRGGGHAYTKQVMKIAGAVLVYRLDDVFLAVDARNPVPTKARKKITQQK